MIRKKRKLIPDRNYRFGGKSFYFFDFDNNIANLSTKIILFHKQNKQYSLELSSEEFIKNQELIGINGKYKDFEFKLCDQTGSFRNFRDKKLTFIQKIKRHKQFFLEDIESLDFNSKNDWQGPSWKYFEHAVNNKRIISIITARGHSKKTVKLGINHLAKTANLLEAPRYLSIFPVSNKRIYKNLSNGEIGLSISELKRRAIIRSVEKAFKQYGFNPYHRFGMSDDDPDNVREAISSMKILKSKYPENQFFVFETSSNKFIRHDVLH